MQLAKVIKDAATAINEEVDGKDEKIPEQVNIARKKKTAQPKENHLT